MNIHIKRIKTGVGRLAIMTSVILLLVGMVWGLGWAIKTFFPWSLIPIAITTMYAFGLDE